jgi:hypothetical protein
MTPVQLFGVVVRSVGFLMTVYGTISSCLGLVFIVAGGLTSLIFGLPAMCVGLWLMRGPVHVIAFAYPADRDVAA